MSPVASLVLHLLASAAGLLFSAPGCACAEETAPPAAPDVAPADLAELLPPIPIPVPVVPPAQAPAPAPPPQDPPPPKDPAPAPQDPRSPAKDLPIPAPAPEKTSADARELLARAARRQGTDGLVGAKAPDRFRVYFATVVLHSERGDKVEVADTNEAFALPAPGKKEARLRSEWIVEHKKVLLGHDGRLGWMKDGDEPVRRFVNRERDEQDIKDLDSRRRMLRLAHRVFFLGNLADGAPAVTLLPDEERVFPRGAGEPRKVKCRVLRRAADPEAGEPGLLIYLDAATLDAVAVTLLAPKEGEPSFLLTLDYDADDIRAKRSYPKGVRVPDWVEMFEVPADPATPPALRIQAGLSGLYIDPESVPDSLFAVPK